MTDDRESASAKLRSFDAVADEFAERCRRGEGPTVAEYAAQYPHLADKIHQLFPSIAMMEQLGDQQQAERRDAYGKAGWSDPPLDRVGDFQIVREIGRGGMGIVFEAVQESLGRRVAVKMLARQALLDEKHVRRFRREAKTVASLHHTNIVPVFGCGEYDGYHYYVMQYIPGAGLDEVLAELRSQTGSATSQTAGHVAGIVRALRQGAFAHFRKVGSSSEIAGSQDISDESETLVGVHGSDAGDIGTNPKVLSASAESDSGKVAFGKNYWDSVARIGLQVADALHYAHAQGKLHRDVKPGNLLLDMAGVVWVADFGLAKALEHDDVSRTGDVVGTLRYMAPEQFAGQADFRSDIYSLGLTLYELLTLKVVFEDSRRTHLVASNGAHHILPLLTAVNAAIPCDLETIVMKACAHDALDRYQTAAEMAADLQRYLEDLPILAKRSSLSERFVRWCRRNPVVGSLAGVAGLLLILVAASTTIGYVRTNAALTRVSEERAKAEATLGVSLEALDKIYGRFSPNRLIEPTQLTVEIEDGESMAVPAQPVLSRETAALLEDILEFYDELSTQDSDNVELRTEAAKANRRVGDIQQRLGDFDAAIKAYQRAVKTYQAMVRDSEKQDPYTIEIAHIHNEMGNVYRLWQRPDDARRSYRTALELLRAAETDNATPEAWFELARTYYFLAKRNLPGPNARRHGPPSARPGWQGSGPPPHSRPIRGKGSRNRDGRLAVRHRPPPLPEASRLPAENIQQLNHAITLLTKLQKESSNHPEYRYLLALCHREREDRGDTEGGETAIRILTDLSQEYPLIADYRYELSETLARLNSRAVGDDEFLHTRERLLKALAYADALVEEHPNIPEYAHSRAHTSHKLSYVYLRIAWQRDRQSRRASIREAEKYCRQAVAIQAEIVEQSDQAPTHQLWLAEMQESLAKVLEQQAKIPEARMTVEASIASLHKLLEEHPDFYISHGYLAKQYRTLIHILEQLDEVEAIAVAREQVRMHRQKLPVGGRVPPREEAPR